MAFAASVAKMTRTTIQPLKSAAPEQVARYQVTAMEKVRKREKREKQLEESLSSKDMFKIVVNELSLQSGSL